MTDLFVPATWLSQPRAGLGAGGSGLPGSCCWSSDARPRGRQDVTGNGLHAEVCKLSMYQRCGAQGCTAASNNRNTISADCTHELLLSTLISIHIASTVTPRCCNHRCHSQPRQLLGHQTGRLPSVPLVVVRVRELDGVACHRHLPPTIRASLLLRLLVAKAFPLRLSSRDSTAR
eukprot:COSAG01_NODE_6178_length_3808_cov_67.968994_4_plen_175_part_00